VFDLARPGCHGKEKRAFENPILHTTWRERLREVFESIDDPRWDGGDATHPLMSPLQRFDPMRKIRHPGERIV
jgi:putative proteasome-type protease